MDEYKTYQCCRCGEKFLGTESYSRDDGFYVEYWGSSVWMPYVVSICPVCESEDIYEVEEEEEE